MSDVLLARLGPGWTARPHPNSVGVVLWNDYQQRSAEVMVGPVGYVLTVSTSYRVVNLTEAATVLRVLAAEVFDRG